MKMDNERLRCKVPPTSKTQGLLFFSFPTRNQVSASNTFRLAELSSETHVFTSVDSLTQSASRSVFESLMAPDTLTLKKGAQVMLVRNIDNNLVNGSIGKVIGFALSSSFPDRPTGTKPGRNGGSNLWPVVQFSISQGVKRVEILEPWRWDVQVNKEIVASRTQVLFPHPYLVSSSSRN
jgi:ATP-dependent DNA helicase PIF1